MSKLSVTKSRIAYQDVLTDEALAFVEALVRKFSDRRDALLSARAEAAERIDAGVLPDFLSETADIRNSDWTVAEAPPIIADRRVEITSPATRKMAINALNSNAKVYMADFEDSLSPTWTNIMEGHRAMTEMAHGQSEMTDKARDKVYRLDPDHRCVLFVRTRGWHLPEKHILYNGAPVSGALVDFGLFFYHNAKVLMTRGRGPFLYLPKVEHWREAALWDDVITFAEDALDIPRSTTKVTLLIETLPAVFQMHEILYAMKTRLVGLNCGRWDYIFSYIKTLRAHSDRILPERNIMTMDKPMLRAYSLALIKTCHQRNAHAMGGMSASLPIKNDAKSNALAVEKVRQDKQREANDGHDGTWVAHPNLIGVVTEVFDAQLSGANQKDLIPNVSHSAEDFLTLPSGSITAKGFDNNIQVALRYIAAWLGGAGAVPIYNLMEDSATAEIARSQLWQWLRYPVCFADGGQITASHFAERLRVISAEVCQTNNPEYVRQATELLDSMVRQDVLDDFLTLKAYPLI